MTFGNAGLTQEVADIPVAHTWSRAAGQQYTLEGYSWGDGRNYGLIDSFNYDNAPFSEIPVPIDPDQPVQQYIPTSVGVISAVGLTNSTFNIEYFGRPFSGSDYSRSTPPFASHAQCSTADGQPNHAVCLT